jgi:hypothetical protein
MHDDREPARQCHLAFFLPRRFAMFIAHAFNQHHFTTRVIID